MAAYNFRIAPSLRIAKDYLISQADLSSDSQDQLQNGTAKTNGLRVNCAHFSGYGFFVTTEFIGLWKKRLAESDINQVRAEVAAVNPFTARSYLMAGESVIKEYEEKQEDERRSLQSEREQKILDIASKAEQQAEEAYRQSRIAIAIAGAACVIIMLIALIE